MPTTSAHCIGPTSTGSKVARMLRGNRKPGKCLSSKPVSLMAFLVSSDGTQTGKVSSKRFRWSKDWPTCRATPVPQEPMLKHATRCCSMGLCSAVTLAFNAAVKDRIRQTTPAGWSVFLGITKCDTACKGMWGKMRTFSTKYNQYWSTSINDLLRRWYQPLLEKTSLN